MVRVNIISDEGQRINRFNNEFPEGWEPKGLHLENGYLERYSPPGKRAFIETGTYKGETVKQMLDYGFEWIRSCDLSMQNLEPEFEKLMATLDPVKYQLVIGDSPDCIPVFLREAKKYFNDENVECTFWLDAHASGDIPGGAYGGSPIVYELEAIAKDNVKTHTIFIDDRRLFGSGEWSYVKEQEALDVLKRINPDYKLIYLDGHLPDDVICATVYDNV